MYNYNIEDNDKFGGVNQKDLDKITGGMQVVRESKINLNTMEKMIPPEEAFGRPSQGRLTFLVTQLQKDKNLNKFLDDQNRKMNDLLSKQTYFKNPEHMKTI